ncbi:MAG TPA: radical SAM protein [Candidatus Woesebacteria bacterium]|nr:radical SAM protein [Candidatus Woesebacteria bacterium]
MVQEIEAKTALNKLNSKYLPYHWDLNIYRGCSHHCVYCYALYSHQYLQTNNFYQDIFVKTNIAQVLEKQLSSPRWRHQVVNLGGVTDNYQPLESQYQLMPQVLKLFTKYRTPITISTKSDLILRDQDLIYQLAAVAPVNIAVTITTFNESLRQLIEPGAVSSLRRLSVLKNFKHPNISLGLHFMPMLPLITDTPKNVEEVFSQVSSAQPNYIITGFLNLRSATKINFLKFLQQNFPHLYLHYHQIYRGAFVNRGYAHQAYQSISTLRQKYHLNPYHPPLEATPSQLSLI